MIDSTTHDQSGSAPAPATGGNRSSEEIEQWICAKVAELLEIDREEVDEQAPFACLGLDSIQGFSLVGEMADWLGQDVPVTVLWEHPDIRAASRHLASVLAEDEEVRMPPSKRVVALNRSPVTSAPPLHCVCGIHLYQGLARRLESVRQVSGVFIPVEIELLHASAEGGTVDFPSVKEIAAAYVEEIRSSRPRGPYALAGASFGGVLAFEIAQQLRAAGETVELVAMFDSILPCAVRLQPGPRLAHLIHRFFELGPIESVRELSRRAKGRSVGGRLRAVEHMSEDIDDDTRAAVALRRRVYNAAMKTYEPAPFPGRVLFFRAAQRHPTNGFEIDRSLGWGGEVAEHWEILEAPGSHLGMLEGSNVDVVADQLRPILESSDLAASAT